MVTCPKSKMTKPIILQENKLEEKLYKELD